MEPVKHDLPLAKPYSSQTVFAELFKGYFAELQDFTIITKKYILSEWKRKRYWWISIIPFLACIAYLAMLATFTIDFFGTIQSEVKWWWRRRQKMKGCR